MIFAANLEQRTRQLADSAVAAVHASRIGRPVPADDREMWDYSGF